MEIFRFNQGTVRYIKLFVLTVSLILVLVMLSFTVSDLRANCDREVTTSFSTKDVQLQLAEDSQWRNSNITSSARDVSVLNALQTVENNPLTASPPLQQKVKVVILSYMRSGSSFTGDVFEHHPEVFYTYEPLLANTLRFDQEHPVEYFDRDPEFFNSSDPNQMTDIQNTVMKHLIACHFRSMNLMFLKENIFGAKSSKYKNFVQCRSSHATKKNIQQCLPLLEKPCSVARVNVAKTVRLSMEQAAILLMHDPGVKVVHVIRDPRGKLSQGRRPNLSKYEGNFSTICSRIQHDIELSRSLKQQFPGRILTARYEDLAESPFHFFALLLHFSKLRLTSELAQRVWNITSTGKSKKSWHSIVRGDSYDASQQWRREISAGDLSSIDQHCNGVYRLLGYVPLRWGKDLRNLSLPSYLDYTLVPGLWTLRL